jgi:hypothetical protein
MNVHRSVDRRIYRLRNLYSTAKTYLDYLGVIVRFLSADKHHFGEYDVLSKSCKGLVVLSGNIFADRWLVDGSFIFAGGTLTA